MWIDILSLVGGLVVLLIGGEFLVRGASNMAYSFQITPLVVGLTIVAFGTSAPELLISVQAALDGASELAMGNVVGSNICNLTLVLGVTALVYPIIVNDNSIKIDWMMTMGSSILLFFFISRDFMLDKFEGVIFVLILVIYTYFLIEMSRRETREKMLDESDFDSLDDIPKVSGKQLIKEIGILAVGAVGLYFGSEWFVGGAQGIARAFEVDEVLVGLTVVAFGTSLPELVASSIAAYHKNTDLAIGNLLGSCIFNNLSILGFTAIVNDSVSGEGIAVAQDPILSRDFFMMLGVILVVLPMMISNRRIGRIEGFILLVAYFVYMYFIMPSLA